ncbi:INCE protein, partial [Glaucidium brasilianum]|nr:INCE protein [Glaucidium brasilianum]
IKNFIKRNTSTRPDLKSELISLQEKERQRLESLRKKQEAEEQRKKKVEEEKRRRQAEMKQKREERLRKALQARERVEQMEEEKKKRMEQRILQNDEKVRTPQAREEKVAEERSKKKLSKKHGEADVQKQKGPRLVRATLGTRVFFSLLQEKDEFEQQEPLQRRRDDEVKGKVLELKSLLEQKHVEEVKESSRFWLPSLHGEGPRPACGIGNSPLPSCPVRGLCPSPSAAASHRLQPCPFVPEPCGAGEGPGCLQLAVASPSRLDLQLQLSHFQKSISTPYLGLPKGTEGSKSPEVDRNNYGMDLNSDDSTDDENEPRKPVPAWADGAQLNEAIVHQYYHPVNVDRIFGLIPSPKLEDIFGKSKPRYFKRTSSAVWHSPP